MFKVTVEGSSLDEIREGLNNALAALGNTAAPKKKPLVVEVIDDEPAPKPKKKPAPPADDEDAELDYEADIRPVVVALSKEFSRELALEVLGKFTNPATDEPATKGQEVNPEDWPALLAACAKARKKAQAAKAAEED